MPTNVAARSTVGRKPAESKTASTQVATSFLVTTSQGGPATSSVALLRGQDAAAMTSPDGLERLLTRKELAWRWGCSEKKLANDFVLQRSIPAVKIGRLVRHRLADVIAYEQKQTRRSSSDRGDGHDA